jgi:nucleoside-diphosphate-sugar epimerase
MNILILGGTRFIGPYVVQFLLELGHDVTVFNRGRNPIQPPKSVRHIIGDRHSLRSFSNQFRKIAPSIVIDMCAYNESEAASTMEVFSGMAGRVVIVSSMDVYRGWDRFFNRDTSFAPHADPFTETSQLRERFYPKRKQSEGASDWRFKYEKILVERAAANHPQLPSTVLRLASIYGPGDHQYRLFDIVKRMGDKRPAILMDKAKAKWRWTWGYVEDVAHAIVLAATDKQAEYQIYNVGEEQTRTQEEWVRALAQTVGWKGRLVTLDAAELPVHLQDAEPVEYRQNLALDSGKIRQELNFSERVPFESSIARTVDWLREHPPANIESKDFDYEAEDACLGKHSTI